MYVTLLVSVLVVSSTSLAEFVITAHDRLTEELNDVSARGLFGFDVEGYLKKNGYPFENHVVTTEDGYILGIHRIPSGKNSTVSEFADETKPVVLIMHGALSNSVDFLLVGPERALPMILADQGYDVWLGNNRGNTWSRNHTALDPDNNKTFWDFSFHDMGLYDTPSIIDYILDTTGSEKISYIGHSQGSTQFFVMTSEKPEYNDKINIMMALGPAVYCNHMANPLIQAIKNYYTLIEFGADYLNITEVLGHSFVIETALKLICKDGSQYQEVCSLVLFLLFGFDSAQFNRTILATQLEVFPAGISIKALKHYLQLIESGHFRQFDHGVLNNMDIYDQFAPPDYNLTLVTAPVVIYYGQNDWLVAEADIDRLAEELPNLVEKHLIEYSYFNHMDFIAANDVVYLLHFYLINKLNEVNGLDVFTTISTTPTTVPSTSTTESTVTPNVTNPSSNTTTSEVTTSTVSGEPDGTTRAPGAATSLTRFVHVTCIFMIILKCVI